MTRRTQGFWMVFVGGVVVPGLLLLARPTVAQVMVTGSALQERAVSAGSAYRGTIALTNPTGTTQSVRLYQTEYTFSPNGEATFGPVGTASRSNAGWIELGMTSATLDPGQTLEVPYTVGLPDDARLAGTYWSMIMVEPQVPARSVARPVAQAAEPNGPSGNGGEVRLSVDMRTITRHAVQVVTHVADTGVRRLRFYEPTLIPDLDGSRVFQVDILNEGERSNRVTLRLEMYDAAGGLVHESEHQVGLIHPGTGRRARFALGAIPQGDYRAVVMADTGESDLVGAQFRLGLYR